MKTTKIIYWLSTSLLILFVGAGSFADLLKVEAIKQSFIHINFPEYMLPFFGLAKLGGTIAIILRRNSLIGEWAYAGIIFYFVGANYVHVAVGDGIDKLGITLFILTLSITSYVFNKKINVLSK